MVLTKQPSFIPLYLACLFKKPEKIDQNKLTNLSNLAINMSNVRIKTKQLNKFESFFNLRKSHDAVPITFLHLLVFRPHLKLLLNKQLPLPVLGLVHLNNEIISHENVHINDPLDINISVNDIKDTPRGIEISLHSNIYVDTKLVWESYSCYLNPSKSKKNVRPLKRRVKIDAQNIQQESWYIPSNLGRKYALLSGDANPIHLCNLSAKLFGFKQAISHGMCMAFKCSSALERLSTTNKASRIKVEFHKPAYLGKKVTFNYHANQHAFDFNVTSGLSKMPIISGEMS